MLEAAQVGQKKEQVVRHIWNLQNKTAVSYLGTSGNTEMAGGRVNNFYALGLSCSIEEKKPLLPLSLIL